MENVTSYTRNTYAKAILHMDGIYLEDKSVCCLNWEDTSFVVSIHVRKMAAKIQNKQIEDTTIVLN